MSGTIDAEAVLALARAEGAVGGDGNLGIEDDLFLAGLDSLGIMQLLLGIEERFGVALDPGDLTRESFSTARRLADLIAARRG